MGIIAVQGERIELINYPGRIIINMGDTFDRGHLTNAFQLWGIFEELQRQGKEKGTEVVRLVGNHEVAYLQNMKINPSEANDNLRNMIKETIEGAVLEGNLLAAYAERDVLYVHAGVDVTFLTEFYGKDAAAVAKEINERFINYSPPVQIVLERV